MTKREYDIQQDGDQYIAIHSENRRKNVKVSKQWTEKDLDEVEAPWESIIDSLVNHNFSEILQLNADTEGGSVEINKACERMVAENTAKNETHARAIVETLIDQNVFELTDGDLILFRNPTGQETHQNNLFNWAAVINATTDRIEEQIDRAEKMDETLQKRMEIVREKYGRDIESDDLQEQRKQIKRRLLSLGDDKKKTYPDPDELDRAGQNKLEHLQRMDTILQSRQRLRNPDTVLTDREIKQVDIEEEIGRQVEGYEELQLAFQQYHLDIRESIAYEMWDNKNVADLLNGLVDMLADIARLDTSLQNQDYEAFKDSMDDVELDSESTTQSSQRVQEDVEDKKEDAQPTRQGQTT